MFDALLKGKFYSKCKSAIKLTKSRLEITRRRRNAMQKFLKNDIADLLQNGLHINAYGRAEVLLIELNVSACYNFIAHFCGCISKLLSKMNTHRECPEECREAVPSLMLAAGSFADLPEFRDLRSIFSHRYGNSLEAHVNQEFVEKLKAVAPTKDKKLRLLQEVSLESGIEWDSKALEQKLYNPPPLEQVHNKFSKQGTENEQQHNVRTTAAVKNKEDFPSHGVKEVSDGKLHGSQKNALRGGNNQLQLSHRKTEKDTPCKEDNPVAKPKPRSVRRIRLKLLPPVSEEDDGAENIHSNETKQDATGKESLSFPKEQDEEERIMDMLLAHYSRKQSGRLEVAAAPACGNNATENRSKERLPCRATSLPPKPTNSVEAAKGTARASSFQPNNGHMHPKLPDYDDFVARLAALRGK